MRVGNPLSLKVASVLGLLASSCWCGEEECLHDEVRCGGECVRLAVDLLNCGACGNRCPGLEDCDNGVCECDVSYSGYGVCSGVCVDLRYDEANCGACAVVCSDPTPHCVDFCTSCPGAECGGQCTDRSTDPANCGECFVSCASFDLCVNELCSQAVCVRGLCESPTAAACEPRCDHTAGMLCCRRGLEGVCVDVLNDPANCGGCDWDCEGEGFDHCCEGQCCDPPEE